MKANIDAVERLNDIDDICKIYTPIVFQVPYWPYNDVSVLSALEKKLTKGRLGHFYKKRNNNLVLVKYFWTSVKSDEDIFHAIYWLLIFWHSVQAVELEALIEIVTALFSLLLEKNILDPHCRMKIID